MTVRPIIFSAPMVRAILEGRKTQTRRPAWQAPRVFIQTDGEPPEPILVPTVWQKAEPGDLLWVRETWKPHSLYAGMKPREMPPTKVFYRSDEAYAPSNTPWVPAIHMPRWASRITLDVTDVRLERLQEITPADAIAEGIMPSANSLTIDCDTPDPREEFRDLWDAIHGPGAWEANPEVVVIGFRPRLRNIDEWSKAA